MMAQNYKIVKAYGYGGLWKDQKGTCVVSKIDKRKKWQNVELI